MPNLSTCTAFELAHYIASKPAFVAYLTGGHCPAVAARCNRLLRILGARLGTDHGDALERVHALID